MLRRTIPGLLALFVLAGCPQDYNFTPVGKCIIQPGSSRFELGGVATADVLFVVDDSGSMIPEQTRLANNFTAFITALATAQKDRVASGQEPFEFHVAVTTSSVFDSWTPSTATTCSGNPAQCSIAATRWGRGVSVTDCTAAEAAANGVCNDLLRSYYWDNANFVCTNPGVAQNGAPFPAGQFVKAGANPRVLHFTKDLDWNSWGTASPDPALTALMNDFKANINVGACGSGMEQHLEAGRLAVQSALAGQQAGVTASEWPHANSKLVVVWVGDEDDCSNPNEPVQSLAFDSTNAAANLPGNDACVNEEKKPVASQKLLKIADYASYFTTLVDPSKPGQTRPFAAAFIYSALIDPATHSTQYDASGHAIPGKCTCQCPSYCNSCPGSGNDPPECTFDATASGCQGWIPNIVADDGVTQVGSRFFQMANAIRGTGSDVFEASICEADWSKTLNGIAELVKPPPGLTLPTEPATSDVVVLRIDQTDGSIRYCSGPGTDKDWYFITCGGSTPTASNGTVGSKCININHGAPHTCDATSGTYVAQYLGRVPAEGCTKPAGEALNVSQVCADKLSNGAGPDHWKCLGATAGDATTVGTCVCQE